MRKLIYTILFIGLLTSGSWAQVNRTRAPKPGPAPEIKLGKYESFELKNGLKVFVVENHKLPRVSFSLVLDNDPVLEKDKAGYTGITGSLLRNGTTSKTKAQLDEEVDFIGASLSTSAGGIRATSLTKHMDKLLQLMTDVLYNPLFSQEELDKLKKQTISGLQASKEDPSSIAGNVRRVLLYSKRHPYGELMTEKTVESITLADCRAYYKKYFVPSNAYLVIVGDIDKSTAKKTAQKYFSKWKGSAVQKVTYEQPVAPEKTQVALVDRTTSVQSVINVAYPINLKPGEPDVIRAVVLNQILGGGFSSRLSQNLREDKAFTYGAYSSLSSDRIVGNFNASANVRNEVTDSAVHEFMYELKRIVENKVTEKELKAAKAVISGNFGRALEEPQTVAGFALDIARYGLADDYFTNYLKRVEAVTLADVKTIAAKYIKPENAYILVVGKGDDIADKLKKFGALKYYDIYGEPYDPSASASVPKGFTASTVLEKYINAIGGKEKLKTIKDIKITMTADAFGNKIDMVSYKKSAKFLMEVRMAGNMVNKQLYADGKASFEQMGNNVPLDESKIQEIEIDSKLFPELEYEKIGVKAKLLGVKKFDDKDMYALEISYPTGKKIIEYYNMKTGFKESKVETVQTPEGEIPLATEYTDYKKVDGVAFPHTIKLPLGGPNKMNAKVLSIEINKGISDDTFK